MVPGASNTLEKFLLRTMSCNQMTAAVRVNTLWKYLYSEPARWLAGWCVMLGREAQRGWRRLVAQGQE